MSDDKAESKETNGETGATSGAQEQRPSLVPVYRVTVMSWCFQFLLDLLWIPLAAYFKDLGLGLHILGMVFAANLGVRILPNVLATRLGVKTDFLCMFSGLVCFAVNLAWPAEIWAIFVMSAGGGMAFVRAHLSVHGKIASAGSKDHLTLASKWCGAARNAGTVVAFSVPVLLYDRLGWTSVVIMAMCVMVLYMILAVVQHTSASAAAAEESQQALDEGLVEAPSEAVRWIDWVMAGAFCVTELQFNVAAAAVPTTLMRTFNLHTSVVGAVQAGGQIVAMSFLMLLSKGYFSILQKRPLNLVLSFSGSFAAICALWMGTALQVDQVGLIIASLYFYYIAAYTAQVTLLECLLGVLDMQSSILVMGTAEVFGCGFSLVGGYLGPALLEVNKAAPYALQMGVALLTTSVLALTLGHRAVAQVVVCETQDQYDANMQEMISRRPSIRKSLTGLKHMKDRPDSYIGVEQRFRRHSKQSSLTPISSCGSLKPIQSSGSLCPVSSSQSLCPDESAQQEGSPPPRSPEPALKQPLLPSNPTLRTLRGGHQRCTSEVLPVPDAAASTFDARQFKKAMVNWDLSYFDIDTKDYQLETTCVKQLVVTHHRRVKSSG